MRIFYSTNRIFGCGSCIVSLLLCNARMAVPAFHVVFVWIFLVFSKKGNGFCRKSHYDSWGDFFVKYETQKLKRVPRLKPIQLSMQCLVNLRLKIR